jgi:hypothetical protein
MNDLTRHPDQDTDRIKFAGGQLILREGPHVAQGGNGSCGC